MTTHHHKKHHHLRPDDVYRLRDDLDRASHPLPTGPTTDSYRIVSYVDGLIGAKRPECDLLRPHYDSGLKWPDKNNPKPDDVRWGGGVRAGVKWDGTFYRDLLRYAASGELFWSAYLKPGSGPGDGNGYWFNFGGGWSYLANDDFSQLLTGASQRIVFEAGQWKLVIEATMFVTGAVVNVWTGTKAAGGNDPVGQYTRVTGCDPLATVSIEVV